MQQDAFFHEVFWSIVGYSCNITIIHQKLQKASMTAAQDHEILLGKKLSKRSSLVAKPTIRSSRIYKVFMCNHTITKGVSSCEMKYYMVSMMSTIVGASIFLVNNHFHFRFFIYPFFLLLPSIHK